MTEEIEKGKILWDLQQPIGTKPPKKTSELLTETKLDALLAILIATRVY